MTVDKARSLHRSRLRLVLAAAAVAFMLIAARLAYLQVVEARTLSRLAEKQWRRELALPGKRGTIYDRQGQPLALSVDAYDIYATPYQVSDAASTAATLASVLGDAPARWEAKLSRGGGFVWLQRRVDVTRATVLKGRRLPGLGFVLSSRRTYPMGAAASQIVGLAGTDGTGLYGLELSYDAMLADRPGLLEADRDPMGRTLPGGFVRTVEPRDGQSVKVSVDSDIQYKAQVELQNAIKQYHARGGAVVVMDPRSGEVVADVSAPGAEPAHLTTKTMPGMKDRVIADAFEPGSTMKVVTVAAALDEGVVTPQTMFNLPPTFTTGGHTVHEAHARGTVDFSVSDILAHSSNIGAVKIGLKLGRQRLYTYIERFGLTTRTGIDLPGEASGLIPRPAKWSRSSISTIPFGQGIAATPMEMARVMATIANDGVAVRPHLLMSKPETISPALAGQRVVSTDTARSVKAMMCRVVTTGTGEQAKVDGYTVAGKTGTANKILPGGRGYAAGAYWASFIGFAPASRPRLVCLVAIDEPSSAVYGGVVAAPVFSRIMRFALVHLKVPPDASTGSAAPKGGRG